MMISPKEKGQGLVEYSLILVLVAIVVVAGYLSVGNLFDGESYRLAMQSNQTVLALSGLLILGVVAYFGYRFTGDEAYSRPGGKVIVWFIGATMIALIIVFFDQLFGLR